MAIYAHAEILTVTVTPKPLKQVIEETEALLGDDSCRCMIKNAIRQMTGCQELWVEPRTYIVSQT